MDWYRKKLSITIFLDSRLRAAGMTISERITARDRCGHTREGGYPAGK